MIVVPPIGAHLVHPRFALVRLAQRLLDRRVDEDALDLGLLRRRLDDPRLALAPMRGIDGEAVGPHHVDGRHLFALGAVEPMVGHRRQPDVGVEADLMRGVAGQHRPAARLRNVADQNARPDAFLRRLAREALEKGDHRRMAPGAIARQAHHLPGRRRRPAAHSRRRGSRANRSRSSAPALRPASSRGRTLPWRRAWDRRDWRAAAAAPARACPCPAPPRRRARRAAIAIAMTIRRIASPRSSPPALLFRLRRGAPSIPISAASRR